MENFIFCAVPLTLFVLIGHGFKQASVKDKYFSRYSGKNVFAQQYYDFSFNRQLKWQKDSSGSLTFPILSQLQLSSCLNSVKFRSSRLMSSIKNVCKKFRKIHRETPVPESLFIKVTKKRLLKFSRTPFLQNISRRLLL